MDCYRTLSFILQISPKYGSAILLIRNPFDALVAEWNRLQGQKIKDPSQNGSHHVKYVGREYFGESTWQAKAGTQPMRSHAVLRHMTLVWNERIGENNEPKTTVAVYTSFSAHFPSFLLQVRTKHGSPL